MTIENQQLEDRLLRLARDKSQQGRRALMENISDLFVGKQGRPGDHERSLITDILTKLVHEVEMAVRRDIAERLSHIDDAPRELMVMLGNDEIEVARPILLKSGVLQDPDLMEIIERRSMEHSLAVAMRAGVSEEVADALVEHGDDDVVEALLNNGDAVLSRRASEYLVEESRRVDRFQEPLLRRPDLPPDLAHRMFWWVSAALRKHILRHYAIDEVGIDEHIQASTKSVQVAPKSSQRQQTDAEKLVARLAELGELTDRFLLQALRQRYLTAFTAGLARMGSLDLKMSGRIIYDAGGEALTVACKAIGMDRAIFASIFLLTRRVVDGGGATAPSVVEHMLRIYDKLPQDKARRTLKFWQRDADYVTAISQVDPADTHIERIDQEPAAVMDETAVR